MRGMKILSMFFLFWIGVSMMYAQEDPKNKVGDILTYYYVHPLPEKVPQALKEFISSSFFNGLNATQQKNLNSTAYSFGRIAQFSPEILSSYLELFATASSKGRIFLLQVFQFCATKEVQDFLLSKVQDTDFSQEREIIQSFLAQDFPMKFNPLLREAQTAEDLDFLWAEFMVSGDAGAVQKIISVLNWPDRVRSKLTEYLRSQAASQEKEKIIQLLNTRLQIASDLKKQEITTRDDLDIILAKSLRYSKKDSEAFHAIRDALRLTDQEFLYLVTKWSASWSLDSNCRQHPRVFEICLEEIARQKGSARIELLRMVIMKYLSDYNISEAAYRLKQLILENPNDAFAHYSLGMIHLRNRDFQGASLEIDSLRSLGSESAALLERELDYARLEVLEINKLEKIQEAVALTNLVKETIAAVRAASSYGSRLYMFDFTNEKLQSKQYKGIEWDIQYETPDRFSVMQQDHEHGVADRWMSIEKKHYFEIGMWFEEPENTSQTWDRNKTNNFLTIEKYLKLMEENSPDPGEIYCSGSRYAVLEYKPKQLLDFYQKQSEDNISFSLFIWIDKASKTIVKTVVKVKGTTAKNNPVDLEYMQLFSDFNKVFQITRPKEIMGVKPQDEGNFSPVEKN